MGLEYNVSAPLINPIWVRIERLDHAATHAKDPPGSQGSAGYNYTREEPVVSYAAGVADGEPEYMTAVDVSAQMEYESFERIRAVFGGDAPVTKQGFVLHRRLLRRQGLIDVATGQCLLKNRDKITGIYRGRSRRPVSIDFALPLYIYEVRGPGSPGLGRDGYDLHIIYTSEKDVAIGA
jgi:hypothetical protein